ncbi:hypothetical protein L6164_007331 [Bauhinia variegata]|uniref:Uncharacterized protein n=1 Tax=Bauhinia variegata TaxID=167791 RepID=A0ACB9PCI2_BAUVA|nr:hypothetical protein L6164_007331 [Bauhinia variegata]
MLGFTLPSQSSISIPIVSIPTRRFSTLAQNVNFVAFSSLPLKTQPSIFKKTSNFLVFAEKNGNGVSKQTKKEDEQEQEIGSKGDDNSKKDRQPILNFNWRNLLAPDPDNILAIGLTGILTWASVQVLLQLLLISFAILVAALKYSFIAALLLFILITLL